MGGFTLLLHTLVFDNKLKGILTSFLKLFLCIALSSLEFCAHKVQLSQPSQFRSLYLNPARLPTCLGIFSCLWSVKFLHSRARTKKGLTMFLFLSFFSPRDHSPTMTVVQCSETTVCALFLDSLVAYSKCPCAFLVTLSWHTYLFLFKTYGVYILNLFCFTYVVSKAFSSSLKTP